MEWSEMQSDGHRVSDQNETSDSSDSESSDENSQLQIKECYSLQHLSLFDMMLKYKTDRNKESVFKQGSNLYKQEDVLYQTMTKFNIDGIDGKIPHDFYGGLIKMGLDFASVTKLKRQVKARQKKVKLKPDFNPRSTTPAEASVAANITNTNQSSSSSIEPKCEFDPGIVIKQEVISDSENEPAEQSTSMFKVESNKVLSAYENHRHLEPPCSRLPMSEQPKPASLTLTHQHHQNVIKCKTEPEEQVIGASKHVVEETDRNTITVKQEVVDNKAVEKEMVTDSDFVWMLVDGQYKKFQIAKGGQNNELVNLKPVENQTNPGNTNHGLLCSHCYNYLSTKEELEAHQKSVHVSGVSCYFCGLTLKTTEQGLEHVSENHSKVYRCLCNRRFQTKIEYEYHTAICSYPILERMDDVIIYVCLLCNKSTSNKTTFYLHCQHAGPLGICEGIKIVTPEATCSACQLLFLDKQAKEFHQSKYANQNVQVMNRPFLHLDTLMRKEVQARKFKVESIVIKGKKIEYSPDELVKSFHHDHALREKLIKSVFKNLYMLEWSYDWPKLLVDKMFTMCESSPGIQEMCRPDTTVSSIHQFAVKSKSQKHLQTIEQKVDKYFEKIHNVIKVMGKSKRPFRLLDFMEFCEQAEVVKDKPVTLSPSPEPPKPASGNTIVINNQKGGGNSIILGGSVNQVFISNNETITKPERTEKMLLSPRGDHLQHIMPMPSNITTPTSTLMYNKPIINRPTTSHDLTSTQPLIPTPIIVGTQQLIFLPGTNTTSEENEPQLHQSNNAAIMQNSTVPSFSKVQNQNVKNKQTEAVVFEGMKKPNNDRILQDIKQLSKTGVLQSVKQSNEAEENRDLNQSNEAVILQDISQSNQGVVLQNMNQSNPAAILQGFNQTNQAVIFQGLDQSNQAFVLQGFDQSNQAVVLADLNQSNPAMVLQNTNQSNPAMFLQNTNQSNPAMVMQNMNPSNPTVVFQGVNQSNSTMVLQGMNQSNPAVILQGINQLNSSGVLQGISQSNSAGNTQGMNQSIQSISHPILSMSGQTGESTTLASSAKQQNFENKSFQVSKNESFNSELKSGQISQTTKDVIPVLFNSTTSTATTITASANLGNKPSTKTSTKTSTSVYLKHRLRHKVATSCVSAFFEKGNEKDNYLYKCFKGAIGRYQSQQSKQSSGKEEKDAKLEPVNPGACSNIQMPSPNQIQQAPTQHQANVKTMLRIPLVFLPNPTNDADKTKSCAGTVYVHPSSMFNIKSPDKESLKGNNNEEQAGNSKGKRKRKRRNSEPYKQRRKSINERGEGSEKVEEFTISLRQRKPKNYYAETESETTSESDTDEHVDEYTPKAPSSSKSVPLSDDESQPFDGSDDQMEEDPHINKTGLSFEDFVTLKMSQNSRSGSPTENSTSASEQDHLLPVVSAGNTVKTLENTVMNPPKQSMQYVSIADCATNPAKHLTPLVANNEYLIALTQLTTNIPTQSSVQQNNSVRTPGDESGFSKEHLNTPKDTPVDVSDELDKQCAKQRQSTDNSTENAVVDKPLKCTSAKDNASDKPHQCTSAKNNASDKPHQCTSANNHASDKQQTNICAKDNDIDKQQTIISAKDSASDKLEECIATQVDQNLVKSRMTQPIILEDELINTTDVSSEKSYKKNPRPDKDKYKTKTKSCVVRLVESRIAKMLAMSLNRKEIISREDNNVNAETSKDLDKNINRKTENEKSEFDELANVDKGKHKTSDVTRCDVTVIKKHTNCFRENQSNSHDEEFKYNESISDRIKLSKRDTSKEHIKDTVLKSPNENSKGVSECSERDMLTEHTKDNVMSENIKAESERSERDTVTEHTEGSVMSENSKTESEHSGRGTVTENTKVNVMSENSKAESKRSERDKVTEHTKDNVMSENSKAESKLSDYSSGDNDSGSEIDVVNATDNDSHSEDLNVNHSPYHSHDFETRVTDTSNSSSSSTSNANYEEMDLSIDIKREPESEDENYAENEGWRPVKVEIVDEDYPDEKSLPAEEAPLENYIHGPQQFVLAQSKFKILKPKSSKPKAIETTSIQGTSNLDMTEFSKRLEKRNFRHKAFFEDSRMLSMIQNLLAKGDDEPRTRMVKNFQKVYDFCMSRYITNNDIENMIRKYGKEEVWNQLVQEERILELAGLTVCQTDTTLGQFFEERTTSKEVFKRAKCALNLLYLLMTCVECYEQNDYAPFTNLLGSRYKGYEELALNKPTYKGVSRKGRPLGRPRKHPLVLSKTESIPTRCKDKDTPYTRPIFVPLSTESIVSTDSKNLSEGEVIEIRSRESSPTNLVLPKTDYTVSSSIPKGDRFGKPSTVSPTTKTPPYRSPTRPKKRGRPRTRPIRLSPTRESDTKNLLGIHVKEQYVIPKKQIKILPSSQAQETTSQSFTQTSLSPHLVSQSHVIPKTQIKILPSSQAQETTSKSFTQTSLSPHLVSQSHIIPKTQIKILPSSQAQETTSQSFTQTTLTPHLVSKSLPQLAMSGYSQTQVQSQPFLNMPIILQPTYQQQAFLQPTNQQTTLMQPSIQQQQANIPQPTNQQTALMQPANQQTAIFQPTFQQAPAFQPTNQVTALTNPSNQQQNYLMVPVLQDNKITMQRIPIVSQLQQQQQRLQPIAPKIKSD